MLDGCNVYPLMFTPRHLGALTVTACLALAVAPVGASARGPCATRPVTPSLIHHVAPPQSFLSSLSVLRRLQTPADLQGLHANRLGQNELLNGENLVDVPGIVPAPLAAPSLIYADYIRELGSVEGEPEYVVPARVQVVAPMGSRCLRRLSVKDRRHQLKLQRADRARGVVLLFGNSLFLLSMDTYSELTAHPSFLVSGGEPPKIPGEPAETPSGATTDVVYGIVPDGVASVALLSEHNPELTAQITANFFAFEVPASFHRGGATIVWRDASGHQLKGRAEGALP